MITQPFIIKKLEVDKHISALVDLFYVEINFDELTVLKHNRTLVLPTNTIELNLLFNTELIEFTHDGKLKLPYVLVTGQKTKPKIYFTNKKEKKIVIRFRRNSAALFIKESLDRVTNMNLSLFDIFSASEINNLYEKIFSVKQINDSVENINEFLIKRLNPNRMDYLIVDSVGRMENSNGLIHISDIANYYSMSIRQFQRRFRNFIGITPKQFLNNIRVQKFINNCTLSNNLRESIHNSGYYDTSHASKLLTQITGLKLSELNKLNQQELCAVNNTSYLPAGCSSMFYLS